MEIGEYLTNVLSISDLASIRFNYLEPPSQDGLFNIESEWRQAGALVVMSNDKNGLWVFGNKSDVDLLLPSLAKVESRGTVKVQGIDLTVKHEGTFDSTSTWKAIRLLPTASGSQGVVSSLSVVSDAAARHAQALNNQAVSSNSGLPITQEPATITPVMKIEDESGDRTFSPRDIHEHFIAAVLSSLNYHLCRESSFISLNSRTLILPEQWSTINVDGATSKALIEFRGLNRLLMVTLDVHLTSLGTLVIKASPVRSLDLSSVLNRDSEDRKADIKSYGTVLYLAPIGRVARYLYSAANQDWNTTVLSIHPSEERYLADNPHLKYPIEKWKQRCSQWLENKGILRDTFESGGWIMVQIFLPASAFGASAVDEDGLYTPQEKLITMPWPAILCFQRNHASVTEDKFAHLPGAHDPVAFAERWFTAKADRELTVAKRKKERESAVAAVKAQAETERLSANNHSPVALRRASIVGAVYPTPPDGLPIGATPSFDGNVSTPGHPNTQIPQIENDPLLAPKIESDDPDNNLFESSDIKRDQANISIDFADPGGDLFGEMGGDDLFGENDITDADFSFFDEPDISEEKEDKALIVDIVSDKNLENANITGEHLQDPPEDAQPDVEMHDLPSTPTLAVMGGQAVITSTPPDQVNPKASDQIMLASSLIPKMASPPLSPELVFKRLSIARPKPEYSNESNPTDRRLSVFESLDFDISLSQFSEKYGAQGRFTSPFKRRLLPKPVDVLPKTGYLTKRRKNKSTPAENSNGHVKFHPHMITSLPVDVSNDNHSEGESPRLSRGSSVLSDQDDTSITTDEGRMNYLSILKRKRTIDSLDDGNDIASSFQDLNVNQGQAKDSTDPLDLLDTAFLDPDPADWSFAKFFSCPEPRANTTTLSDLEYIAAAQILSDQAISRTLKIPGLTDDTSAEDVQDPGTDDNLVGLVQEKLTLAVKRCFTQANECTLSTYVDIQGQQPIGQLTRLPPRPIPQLNSLHRPETLKLKPTFVLQAPHLQVRRAESKLTVLPSAIPFWENLGLGPSNGGKNINAICVYPDSDGMANNVDTFLEHTRSAYESGKLGIHDRFIHTDITNGLVPVDFGEGANLSVADHQAVLGRINETSTKLGGLLASGSSQNINIVVYYVYDPTNADLLVPICASFHNLFNVYKERLIAEKSTPSNELVLQLVPMDLIASRMSLVVPQPSIYARLAIEVYDRCVDVTSGTTSPSIVLEKPLPRNIDFKLTQNPSASLLQENSVMHVAYSQSVDDRWVTAAWTDNIGTQQATASYCLGRKNSLPTVSISSIAHEIWETTLDIISVRKVHWRVMIAKVGVMEPSEIDFWKGLASTESKAQISLTLITVDTSPSLSILPPTISIPPSTLTGPSLFYTTPVSTPSASVISPNHDQSGNPQTPHSHPPANPLTPGATDGGELKIELDATLIDTTDQTWGVLLSHRLNNSRSLLEFNPALFSGYLIKRNGRAATSTPFVLEVNLVHSEMNLRLYEALLREVLSHYRGLATLARARGVVRGEDGRPWHIAAAEKGVRVLGLLM